MRAKQPSHFNFLLSWLLFLSIATVNINNPALFGNAEFEDSVELEEEIEEGEKEIEDFIQQIQHDEQVVLEHEVNTILHYCAEKVANNSPEKLYLLYHQVKSHLG